MDIVKIPLGDVADIDLQMTAGKLQIVIEADAAKLLKELADKQPAGVLKSILEAAAAALAGSAAQA